MNSEMLKYIVETTGGKVTVVDTNKVYEKFGDCQQTRDDIMELARLGYLNRRCADKNPLYFVSVNQKAIDWLKG